MGERTIEATFGDAERERFRKLLELAADSTFEGERANAIAAAERLAARFGLTLEEAARGASRPPQPPPEPEVDPRRERERDAARWFAFTLHNHDAWIQADKARREQALADAKARGLDAEEARERASVHAFQRRVSRRRMPPETHARILLRETSLTLREIASITSLDVYAVCALKLKMRTEPRPRRYATAR